MDLSLRNAYIAGFIDGEGYLGLMRRWNRNGGNQFFVVPVIKVANTNFEIVEWLQQEFGGHLDKPRRNNIRQKPAVTWSVRNRKLVKMVLEELSPYLKIKKEQADILIEFIDKCGTWRQYAMPESERREYYRRISELNKRGPATTE